MFDNVKLGKLPPKLDNRTLRLSNYVEKLPDAPKTCDLTNKITNLGMMKNDKFSNCVFATKGHMIQTWTAEAGNQVIVDDDIILNDYAEETGFDPNDPESDQGAVELDVLKHWRKNPFVGHKLDAFVSLNPQHTMETRQAIYYFGGAFIGLALPLTAQKQEVWTVVTIDGDGAKGSWGLHSVPVISYDKDYVTCITWGQLVKMSWNFYWYACDEAYALLSPDIFGISGKSPEGFDRILLEQDLRIITR